MQITYFIAWRLPLFFVVLTLFTTTCRADTIPTGVIWPGWRVETEERYDTPGYPITWMLDGNPATTWVYHFHPNPKDEDAVGEKDPYPHGQGVIISLAKGDPGASATDQQPFLLDGIGIINGYAKSSRTYWRNNRIRLLRVTAYAPQRKPWIWTHDFPLRNTLSLQHLALPRMRAVQITLEVRAVDVGKDDDLCISELALQLNGHQLPWHVTPYVIYNQAGGCCGGMSFSVMTRDGALARQPLPKKEAGIMGISEQPGTGCYLLSSQHSLCLYDPNTNSTSNRHTFSGPIYIIGWRDARTAIIGTGKDDTPAYNVMNWFRLTLPDNRVHSTPAIHEGVHRHWPFPPCTWEPDYGA